jgi:ribosomal protein S8
MVIISASVFISNFNNSVVKRSRSFSTPNSSFSRSILALFYKESFIFCYNFDSTKNCFIVYPNHKAVNFKLKLISNSSRKLFFKAFQIKKLTNQGKFFIIKSVFGLQFNDVGRFNKIGGQPIFMLNYFR